jgi:hypothetical protein
MFLPLICAGLVFSACTALIATIGAFLLRRWYVREYSRLAEDLATAWCNLITPKEPGDTTVAVVLMDQFATLMAARLAGQVKAMLAGVESGESKGQQLALIEEATQKSPWLALLASALPKRIRNKLLANPQMVTAMANLHGGMGGNGAGDSPAPRRHRE